MSACVILHSCEKYHFILDEFFEHFEEHFPYKEFTVYHITEKLPYTKPYTQNIVLNDDSWRDRFVKALEQIPHDNFLYLQEDMIILHVDAPTILGAIPIHESNAVFGCVITKLGAFHDFTLQPTVYKLNQHPIFIQSSGPYVMSHQPPAIFNKHFFLKTLYREHNVWTHECEVSDEMNMGKYGRAFALCIGNVFYPVNKSEIITSHHAIRKGIYVPI